jgi:hypothetical protein
MRMPAGAQGADEADTIEVRHVPIGQDKIESTHAEECERFRDAVSA